MSELNEMSYVNEVNTEDNKIIFENQKPDYRRKKHMGLLAKFAFLFAAVAVVQTGIYIPIFSDIFVPSEAAPAEKVVLPETFDIVSVGETEEVISCTINIENVDFEKENCFAYLVKEADATESFLSLVSEKVKSDARVAIAKNTTFVSFSKYMDVSKEVNLKHNTNYVILIVNGDNIVKSMPAKTNAMNYVTELHTDPVYVTYDSHFDKYWKNLKVKATFNTKLDYTKMWFELINTTTNEKEYSGIPKDLLEDGSCPLYMRENTDPVYQYQLKVYCMTNHPEKLDYDSSYDLDRGEESLSHLIYVYDTLIDF